jgi:uncharacterized membrane protein YccC
MFFISDLSLLNSLGEALVVLGLVGAVSLFFFPEGRRLQERSLGVLFAVMAASGVALAWRADSLRNANRDLTPKQQATLSKAISQFPTAKFEVLTSRGDKEAHALALKLADAIKAGSGAMPAFDDDKHALHVGVVLIFAAKDDELHHNVTDTVGRRLMAARIAVISDRAPELAAQTVRIVVGAKP